MEEEVGKYKKRTNSNVSKSSNKSKHKHIYQPCLLEEVDGGEFSNHLYRATYCAECGKIGDVLLLGECETLENGCHVYKFLSKEEMKKKYSEYPVFAVKSIFQKFVCIEGE